MMFLSKELINLVAVTIIQVMFSQFGVYNKWQIIKTH